jgi:hypothetical protein
VVGVVEATEKQRKMIAKWKAREPVAITEIPKRKGLYWMENCTTLPVTKVIVQLVSIPKKK